MIGLKGLVGQGMAPKRITTVTTYPLQSETLAYFAAGSGAWTPAFYDAVNTFIYQAKQLGCWSVISCLWLFCADNPQQAVQNLAGRSFTATAGASLTFTPNKGFGGFGGTTAAQLGFGGFGGSSTPALTATTVSMIGVRSSWATTGVFIGTTSGDYGTWQNNSGVYTGSPAAKALGGSPKVIGGAAGINFYTAGGKAASAGGSTGGVENNYATTPVSPHPIDGWIAAKGYLTAPTDDQAQQVLALLSRLLIVLGALN